MLESTVRASLVDAAGQHVDRELSARLMEQVLNLKMEQRPASSGAFAGQLAEFDQLRDFLTAATVTALVDLPFALLFIVIMGVIGGWLVLLPLAAIPLLVLAAVAVEPALREEVQRMQTGSSQKQAIAVEAIASLEAVKTLGAEGAIQARWERFGELASSASRRLRQWTAVLMHSNTTLQQLVSVGILYFGAQRIFSGDMTMGGLIACSILAGRALAPLGQVTSLLARATRSRSAIANLSELMARPVERPAGARFLQRGRF